MPKETKYLEVHPSQNNEDWGKASLEEYNFNLFNEAAERTAIANAAHEDATKENSDNSEIVKTNIKILLKWLQAKLVFAEDSLSPLTTKSYRTKKAEPKDKLIYFELGKDPKDIPPRPQRLQIVDDEETPFLEHKTNAETFNNALEAVRILLVLDHEKEQRVFDMEEWDEMLDEYEYLRREFDNLVELSEEINKTKRSIKKILDEYSDVFQPEDSDRIKRKSDNTPNISGLMKEKIVELVERLETLIKTILKPFKNE
jgi:hypothetical protein